MTQLPSPPSPGFSPPSPHPAPPRKKGIKKGEQQYSASGQLGTAHLEDSSLLDLAHVKVLIHPLTLLPRHVLAVAPTPHHVLDPPLAEVRRLGHGEVLQRPPLR